jgi:hypothetical protein
MKNAYFNGNALIRKYTDSDVSKISKFFIYVYTNKYSKIPFYVEKVMREEPKDSYLLNIDRYISVYGKYTNYDLAIYVYLASVRDVAMYRLHKINTLQLNIALSLVSDKVIELNPLLKIKENLIYFTLEE